MLLSQIHLCLDNVRTAQLVLDGFFPAQLQMRCQSHSPIRFVLQLQMITGSYRRAASLILTQVSLSLQQEALQLVSAETVKCCSNCQRSLRLY
jgi:hypothetical protein